MINKIKLENFKCFKNIEIELSALNLLTGLNGTGKSTITQALLLMRQSYAQRYLPERVCLNGDYVQLGTGKDVLYEHADKGNEADEDMIGIETTQEHKQILYKLKYDATADVLEATRPYENNDFLGIAVSPVDGYLEYLNAERISPQTIYPKSSFHVDSMHQLGNNGQYTVHYLSKYQDNSLAWDSCNGKEKTLKGAVQYWLNEVSPNIKFNVQDVENTDLSNIGYYFLDKEKSNTFRPTNIGFGVSYVLPVIVACLKATADSILIIENPESHLHPRGQRKMGELISRCAASGVQVFVETHSDHVLNGVRIATKRAQIDSSGVRIFFFHKEDTPNGAEHVVKEPKIDTNGKLDFWPDDFFDEWEKALDEII